MGVGGAGGCGLGVVMPVYDSIWYWRTRLPKRKGQRCRVVARGAMNSSLVENDMKFTEFCKSYGCTAGERRKLLAMLITMRSLKLWSLLK